MTPRQKQLFDMIRTSIADTGVSPTYDGMLAALGTTSRGGLANMLTKLEEDGYIRRVPGRRRNIVVTAETVGLDGALAIVLAVGSLSFETRRELNRLLARKIK